MKEENLESWNQFIDIAIDAIEGAKINGRVPFYKEPLFRGQADSRWKLESTLYRYLNGDIKCRLYDNNMRVVATQIKTVTGIDLEFEDWQNIDLSLGAAPNLEAMSWLRQNGYPSPLVDWSRSPYVASFFAFNEVYSDSVSIYAYVETETGTRTSSGYDPTINSVGKWLSTDKKHHLQQSRYTFCWKECEDDFCYTSHEEGVVKDESDPEQTNVIKYNLPSSERPMVLDALAKMNINLYSLFETPESLLKVLAQDTGLKALHS